MAIYRKFYKKFGQILLKLKEKFIKFKKILENFNDSVWKRNRPAEGYT